MALFFVVLFIVVPLVELFVIVQVAGSIGIIATLALLLAVSIAGSWLVRREGLGILSRARTMVRNGDVPTDEIINGVLVLGAGALLLTPGFVTDVVGLLLLISPTRAVVRSLIRRRVSFLTWIPGAGAAGRAAAAGFGRRVNVGEAVIVTDVSTGGAPGDNPVSHTRQVVNDPGMLGRGSAGAAGTTDGGPGIGS